MFNLEGVREVCVRKVEREDVGLDLVELRFKVTFINYMECKVQMVKQDFPLHLFMGMASWVWLAYNESLPHFSRQTSMHLLPSGSRGWDCGVKWQR